MALIPIFVRVRATPNFVSCLGGLSGLVAAWFYFHYQSNTACFLGLLFMIVWHIFDGADGQLARQTGQTSPLGFVIDGVCDYATFIFVYVALALALSDIQGSGVWFIVVTAGIFHAIQAAAFEMNREFYIRWTGNEFSELSLQQTPELSASETANVITKRYKSIQEYFRPISSEIEDHLLNSDISAAGQALLRDSYQTHFRTQVIAWSILSANNRTIAIFVFCVIGQPLWYFIYEITFLTLVLWMLTGLNGRAQTAFAHELGL
ncbi:MAG: CDP-alcohol phosphatidyltransferase family protein [Rhodospirillaceae bacterium]|nr:CDP-alcohol phosphatidyltransferase family protein [Rhodospirillaceae bacterium]